MHSVAREFFFRSGNCILCRVQNSQLQAIRILMAFVRVFLDSRLRTKLLLWQMQRLLDYQVINWAAATDNSSNIKTDNSTSSSNGTNNSSNNSNSPNNSSSNNNSNIKQQKQRQQQPRTSNPFYFFYSTFQDIFTLKTTVKSGGWLKQSRRESSVSTKGISCLRSIPMEGSNSQVLVEKDPNTA